MQTLWEDLRYSARMLLKNPGFTLIAVITLALGIGANTTIFSSVDAMLLRPFSFPNQARLVMLFERKPSIGVTHAAVSPGNVIEWRMQSQTLQEAVVIRNGDLTLRSGGSPERYTGYGVSATFFEALGVKPQLGRTFRRGEDEAGHAQVTVLSYAFWQKRFGGDPQILGQQIILNDTPFEVIGIMPPGFAFPYGGGEMWTPFVLEPQMKQDHYGHYLRVLALLKPGVTVAQANADLDQIAKRIEQQYPDGEAGHGAYAVALNEEYTRGARTYLPVMIGAVIFVLLIACFNVANLLLMRASVRQKEIALRLALGATRWRLIRQLLTESVMLALTGGALGVVFASWGAEALANGIPTSMSKYIPGWSHLGLNYHVLVFTVLTSVWTGILFGLLPALQTTKINLNEMLKEDGGKGTSGNRGASPVRQTLVVAEIALSLILLIGAGLLVRSFIQLLHTDLGIKPNHVMTMNLVLPADKYPEAQQRRHFVEQLLQRLEALPGVTNIGAVQGLPMSSGSNGNTFQIVGQPAFKRGTEPHTDYRIVTPGYFTAIGTELRRGRSFNAQDNAQSTRVVLVNEAFSARFLKGADAVGQRMTMGGDQDKSSEIIGVVANVMNNDLDDLNEPCIYLPFAQIPVSNLSLTIRVTGAPEEIVPAVRRELAVLDASLPLSEAKTLIQIIDERYAPKKMTMWMLVIFGIIALVMAVVGTYAVMGYSVAQRRHELGVRIALGAQAVDLLNLILRQGLKLTSIGIGLGLAGAFALTRVLKQLLYGTTSTDLLTFVIVASMLVLVALVACYVPARRAAKVDPMIALRRE